MILKGHVERRFQMVPIGCKPVWLVLALQRGLCLACGVLRQVRVDFADPRRRYMEAFERYAIELCRHMTIQDVARHLRVSWDVAKEIQKPYLQRRYTRPKLSKLTRIAIDEITIGKGHRYLTVVVDLGSGAVVFVGDGKGSEALLPFWKRLRPSKARIEAVAIDMSPAYIRAVMDHLPQTAIIFDHFHIIKIFNDKLSDLRRKLYNEARTALEKRLIKGTRWLLLKNPENLDPERNEALRLRLALEINQPLATAYYLKEDLRQPWSQDNKAKAEAFLSGWIARAESSAVDILIKLAHTLAAHRTGILSYYDHPISTAPLEGTNNKIKTMKRQAYGFRDMAFFKLKIMAIHDARYALVG